METGKSIRERLREALGKPDVLWNVFKIIVIAVCFFVSKEIFAKLFVDLPELPAITRIMFFSIHNIVYGIIFASLIFNFLLDRWYGRPKKGNVVYLITGLFMLLFVIAYSAAIIIPLEGI